MRGIALASALVLGLLGCATPVQKSDPAPTVTVVQTPTPTPTPTPSVTSDSEDYRLIDELWNGGADGFDGSDRAYLCKQFKASPVAGYKEFSQLKNIYLTKAEYLRFFAEHC